MGDVLTKESVWSVDFENVLTLPFPADPDIDLLYAAREALTDYIDWIIEGRAGKSQDEIHEAIERAAPRLAEIAMLWPAAEAAYDAEVEAQQKAKEDADPRLDFEPPGEIARDESRLTTYLFLSEGMMGQIGSMMQKVPEDDVVFVALLLARRFLDLAADTAKTRFPMGPAAAATFGRLFDVLEAEEGGRGFGPLIERGG